MIFPQDGAFSSSVHCYFRNKDGSSQHLERVSSLRKYALRYPIPKIVNITKDISKIEKMIDATISVFSWENDQARPIVGTDKMLDDHINIVAVKEGRSVRFGFIKNMSAFLSYKNKHGRKHFECRKCYLHFCV